MGMLIRGAVADMTPAAHRVESLEPQAYFRHAGLLASSANTGIVRLQVPLLPLLQYFRQHCSMWKATIAEKDQHQRRINPVANQLHSDLRAMLFLQLQKCDQEMKSFAFLIGLWFPEKDLKAHPLLVDYEDGLYGDEHMHMLPRDTPPKPRDRESWEEGSQTWEHHFMSGRDTIEEQLSRAREHSRPEGARRVSLRMKVNVTSPEREKRQILVGAIAIGALLLGLQGRIGTLFGSTPPVDKNFIVNEDVLKVLKLDEERLKDLTSATNWLAKRLSQHSEDLLTLTSAQALSSYSEIYYARMREIGNGLKMLLHRNLDPRLVRPDQLRRAMQRLTGAMSREDLAPVLTDTLHLYELDVGHRVRPQLLTIVIEINIPAELVNSRSQLYKFEKFPLRPSQNSSVWLEPWPERRLIAVTMDGTRYREMDESLLSRCRMIHGIFLCREPAVWSTFKRPSCLSSLFRQEGSNVLSTCRFTAMTETERMIQVDNSVFHLFSYNGTELTITCKGSPNTAVRAVQGLVAISLSPGCMARTPYHEVRTTPMIQSQMSIDLRPLDLERLAPAQHLHAFQQLHGHPLLRNGDGLTLNKAIETLKEHHVTAARTNEAWLAINVSLGVILIIVLGVGCYVACAPCQAWCSKWCCIPCSNVSPPQLPDDWPIRIEGMAMRDQHLRDRELNPSLPWPTYRGTTNPPLEPMTSIIKPDPPPKPRQARRPSDD